MFALFSWFKRHLNSWDDICNDEYARLRTNTILCALLVTCFFLVMVPFNLLSNDNMPASRTALFGLISLTLLLIQLRSPTYHYWVAVSFGIMAQAMIIYFIYLGANGGRTVLWAFILPCIAIMVAPLRTSIVYNAVFVALLLILLNTPLRHHLLLEYSPGFSLYFPVVLVFMTACVYLADAVRRKTQSRLRQTVAQLHDTTRKLASFAFIDPLTGAYNRHALASHFGDIRSAGGHGLSFAMLDLDHFKKVNDHYGHFVGDKVLRHVVEQVQMVMPPGAQLYRWGGEEFLLVLKSSDAETARRVLENARQQVENTPLHAEEAVIPLTVSIGGVAAPEGMRIQEAIVLADQRLYQAKGAGRNRVIMD